MLLVSAAIGVYFWWKGQKNTEEFLMASRSMGTIPMTMSLVASFMSAITLLGTPAELYVSGTQYVALVLAYPFVMGATTHMFLPVFEALQVTTSYEYLELRFHKSVRILAGACFTLQMVLYMAIVVYAPALALSQVTGFHLDRVYLLHSHRGYQGCHVDRYFPGSLYVWFLPCHHQKVIMMLEEPLLCSIGTISLAGWNYSTSRQT